MANVKSGNLTRPPQWWKHLRWCKRVFWKTERQAQERAIIAAGESAIHSRGIDRSAKVDDFGDTYWPDSTTPPQQKEPTE